MEHVVVSVKHNQGGLEHKQKLGVDDCLDSVEKVGIVEQRGNSLVLRFQG